jgi:1,3-beta-glucan synthase
MILGTLAEISYIHTTWNNTLYLARRFLYLVPFALLAGPTFYIVVVEN